MKTLVFKIVGMDCAACTINIDGVLEDAKGIHNVETEYVKQQTQVTFDPDKITPEQIIALIKTLEYDAVISE